MLAYGTVAVSWVPAAFKEKTGWVTPLKERAVAPLRLLPVTVTVCPLLAKVGEKRLINGAAAVTVKTCPLLIPPGVVTVTLPVVAPAGTMAVICVVEFTAKAAAVPLKFTPIALEKLVPVRVTLVPVSPLVGLRPVSVGAKYIVVFSSTEAEAEKLLAATMSGRPSPFKSPSATL